MRPESTVGQVSALASGRIFQSTYVTFTPPAAHDAILSEQLCDRSCHDLQRELWPPVLAERGKSIAQQSTIGNAGNTLVHPSSPAEQAIIAEINGYRDLLAGWDGENAQPPSRAAMEEAIRFVRIAGGRAALFEASLDIDGSINLEFVDRSGSLGFEGMGEIVYAVVNGDRGVVSFNGFMIPAAIQSLIESESSRHEPVPKM